MSVVQNLKSSRKCIDNAVHYLLVNSSLIQINTTTIIIMDMDVVKEDLDIDNTIKDLTITLVTELTNQTLEEELAVETGAMIEISLVQDMENMDTDVRAVTATMKDTNSSQVMDIVGQRVIIMPLIMVVVRCTDLLHVKPFLLTHLVSVFLSVLQ